MFFFNCSNISCIAVLSIPADVYKYGATIIFISISHIIGCLVSAYITVPVFHNLPITSTYEYLKLRFNSTIRIMGSILYNINTMLYLPIVIYGPALALSQGNILISNFYLSSIIFNNQFRPIFSCSMILNFSYFIQLTPNQSDFMHNLYILHHNWWFESSSMDRYFTTHCYAWGISCGSLYRSTIYRRSQQRLHPRLRWR